MKITVINGSPNIKGTCSLIIDDIFQKYEINNQINKYHLNTLNIHGCQECFACRSSRTDKCYFKDDLSIILEEVKTTEMLILASPVFYADISAQLKCFLDRTWSYFGINGQSASHLRRNRKIVFLLSFGYSDKDHYNNIIQKYTNYFEMFGFTQIEYIIAYGAQYFNNIPMNKSEIDQNILRIFGKIS